MRDIIQPISVGFFATLAAIGGAIVLAWLYAFAAFALLEWLATIGT